MTLTGGDMDPHVDIGVTALSGGCKTIWSPSWSANIASQHLDEEAFFFMTFSNSTMVVDLLNALRPRGPDFFRSIISIKV